MRILAIDPSSTVLGWAVLTDGDKLLARGEISTKKVSYAERFKFIVDSLSQISQTFEPTEIACEQAVRFQGKRIPALEVAVKSIERWAQDKKFNIAFYAPAEWRHSVIGHGGANKQQARWLVARIFEPVESDHEADAICIGLHHLGVKRWQAMGRPRKAEKRRAERPK